MGFQQGLSGLNASSKSLDTIGNNIANSGTVGYKAGSTQFADVFAASLNGAGAAPVGLGSRVSTIVQQFTQGNISVTNNPLDIAINGGGFFQVDDGQGGTQYSRNGQFQLDKNGFIVNAQGLQLKGIMAVNGVVSPGSPNVPLRLFDPSQSLTGSPQATGTSTGATGVQANINLDSRLPAIALPFNYADPTTYNQSTAVTTYDSLGNPHTYSMYFVKTAANAWDVYATVTNPAGAVPTFQNLGAAGSLAFNTSGQLTSGPIAAAISDADLGYAGAVLPMAFNLNFSGSTQFGSVVRGEYPAAGRLCRGHAWPDSRSATTARCSATTPTASRKWWARPCWRPSAIRRALQPLGNNVWAQTPDSGESILGTPGSSGQFGVLQSAALEDANVDLTAELVSMITQQRVYQANAQTIKTQDSILQTLVNLR
jgi:flagellar hook protein FlgE